MVYRVDGKRELVHQTTANCGLAPNVKNQLHTGVKPGAILPEFMRCSVDVEICQLDTSMDFFENLFTLEPNILRFRSPAVPCITKKRRQADSSAW